MPFSTQHQPRYAVYVITTAGPILAGRYGSLARALEVEAELLETGLTVYHDVN